MGNGIVLAVMQQFEVREAQVSIEYGRPQAGVIVDKELLEPPAYVVPDLGRPMAGDSRGIFH